jgi:tripartite motif-containing protein 71
VTPGFIGRVFVGGLAACLAAMLAAPSATAAAPTYLRTIGEPGHAEMYPSGLDVDPAGNVYVADTGNDQVKKYSPLGTLLWSIGKRKLKALGVFFNPRDVAYIEGRVYAVDTGYNRIQVLDAETGTPLAEWTGFKVVMGVSAGYSPGGEPIVLVTEESKHLVSLYSPAGTLLRWIGSGPGSGDGQLTSPRDAAIDSRGNIYVADYLNNRMAKFAYDGTWLKNWGATGTADGRFLRPYGVDVDAADRVYVADSNNARIQQFDAEGTFLAKWGSKGTGPGQFSHLRRVAVGPPPGNYVYGADLWGTKIEEFTQEGFHALTFGGSGAGAGLFNEPTGLAVGSDVFVVDSVNQRVQRFDPLGFFELVFGQRGWGSELLGFNWPRDAALSADGTLWVADTKNNKLKEFTLDGVPTGRTMGAGGSAIGTLNWPSGLASYEGDLIVANTNSSRVERWDPGSGTVEWTATGFSYPKDVAVFNRAVYVADTKNKRVVRMKVSDGTVTAIFGAAVLHQPSSVAVDEDGHVWVSDSNWNRLVEFDPSGSFIRAFGSLGSAHGKFNNPTALAILNDELYVSDEWNDRIEVYGLG